MHNWPSRTALPIKVFAGETSLDDVRLTTPILVTDELEVEVLAAPATHHQKENSREYYHDRDDTYPVKLHVLVFSSSSENCRKHFCLV